MVILTVKEQLKLEIIQRIMDNQIEVSKAAMILGLSNRSIYRLLSKVRIEGVKAVVHGNRGNNHAGKISERTRKKIIIWQKTNIRDSMTDIFRKNFWEMKVSR